MNLKYFIGQMLNRLFLLLFVLFAWASVSAQSIKVQPYFTAVVVADIDSSMNWYSKMLDVTLRNRADNPDRGFKQAVLFNSALMIELVELTKGIAKDSLLRNYPAGTQSLGFNKIGFSVSDISAVFNELTAKQATFFGKMVTDPISRKRTFLIRDPDGNFIQFFEQ
jgi:predicted enzyme related to lactoylglutathione lyase